MHGVKPWLFLVYHSTHQSLLAYKMWSTCMGQHNNRIVSQVCSDIWQKLLQMTNLRTVQTEADNESVYYARKWTNVKADNWKHSQRQIVNGKCWGSNIIVSISPGFFSLNLVRKWFVFLVTDLWQFEKFFLPLMKKKLTLIGLILKRLARFDYLWITFCRNLASL